MGTRTRSGSVRAAVARILAALALAAPFARDALAAPANDNFANAVALSGVAATASGNNAGATTQSGEPAPNSDGATVWYQWTAPISGAAVVSLRGSSFDTTLAVYTGSSVSSLTTVASNDDGSFDTTSLLSFSATSGTVYRIQVGGYAGAVGNYVLALSYPNNAVGGAWTANGPAPSRNGQVSVSPNNEVCGAIQAIAAHPTNASILYVGAVNGGVWKTTNATATSPTWTPLTDAQAGLSIGSLEFDPTDSNLLTLVAGGARTSSFGAVGGALVGVLRTTDGGANWTALGASQLTDEHLTSVAARGSVILAASDDEWMGGNGSGLFRSSNTGTTFTLISGGTGTGLTAGPVSDLVGDPGNTSRFFCAVRTVGVFRSSDTGATWTNVTSGISGVSSSTSKIEMAMFDNGSTTALYVGVINSGTLAGVWRSTNLGASWTQMDTPPAHNGAQGDIHFSICADKNSSNIVYIGGDSIANSPYTGNLFRGNASASSGSQFTTIVDGNAGNTTPHADSREMVTDANGALIEGDDGGVYRRSSPQSSSGTWSSVVGNLCVFEAHDVAYDGVSHVSICGTQDNGTHVQSATGSLIWNMIVGGDGGDVAVDDASSTTQSVRYASYQDLSSFVRLTYNSSNSLVSTVYPALTVLSGPAISTQFTTPIAINKITPTRLIIGGSNAAYESFNRGDSVTALSPNSGVNGTFSSGPIAYGGMLSGSPNADVLYYGSGSSVKLRTTSGGAIASTATAFPGGTVEDIVLDLADWRRVFVADSSSVYFSTNSGSSWTDVTGTLDGVGSFHTLEFLRMSGADYVVVGTDAGLYGSFVSTLGAWTKVGTGLPNAIVYDAQAHATDRVLVVGTLGRGTFLLKLNLPPTVTMPGSAVAYVENAAATVLDGTATVVDADSPDFVSGSMTVDYSANGAAEDRLAVRNQGVAAGQIGVSGSSVTYGGTTIGSVAGGAGTTPLVVTFSAAAATPAAAQALLRNITYQNVSENPSTLARTVRVVIDDGDGGTSTAVTKTVNVTSVNDAPVVTTSSGALSYLENQTPTPIDALVDVSDVDSTLLVGATVAITSNFVASEDVLAFADQLGITGIYNSATGSLALSGAATVGNYVSALRSVTYYDTSDTPSAATRTVTFTVDDGGAVNNLGSATRTVTVTPQNDPPIVATTSGSVAYVENQPATTIDAAVALSDIDGTDLVGGKVALTTNFAAGQDVLAFANQGGITGSYDAATGVLTLSGAATLTAYQAAFRTVTYFNSSDNPSPATRTVTFTADDGQSVNNLGSGTRTITVTPVNDAPSVSTSPGSMSFIENQPPTQIDPAVLLADVDGSSFVGATVAITANFAAAEDSLKFTNQNGITGSYDAGSGVLTLTGNASLVAYRTALRSVAYANPSENPSTAPRTVTFTVDDGGAAPHLGSATRVIVVTSVNDPPTVTTTTGSLTYLEDQAATPIDPGLVTNDVDGAAYAGATVAITANFAAGQDVLSFVDQDGIVGAYDAGTGTLTLSGAAPIAAYQNALRAVAYSNTSENPSGLTRTVKFTVDDGGASANTGSATRKIVVTPVNDAPTFVLGPDQAVPQEAGPQTVVGFVTAISAGAADEAGQALNFIVAFDHPEIFAVPPAVSVDGTLTYTPAPDGSDVAVVTVRLHDDGGTANGGVDTSAPQTFAIAVTTVAEELGVYNGLALPAAGATPGADKTGLLSLTVGAKGKSKGKLRLGAFTFAFAATTDNSGVVRFGKTRDAALALPRRGASELSLRLRVDVSRGTDRLTGEVMEGGAPFATIVADRALYTARKSPAAPYRNVPDALVGAYTVTFDEPQSPDVDSAALPHGAGVATLKIAKSGVATLAGSLADGSKLSCSGALSKHDEFPLFVALPKGAGVVAGYVRFESTPDDDVAGPGVLWFRPASASALYPAGWPLGVATDVVGSAYRAPSPPAAALSGLGPVGAGGNVRLALAGGGLDAAGLTKSLDVDPKNKVVVVGPTADALTMTISAAGGQFKGTFVHPVGGKKTTFQGVFLQKQRTGSGYFVGVDADGKQQVGSVVLTPVDAPGGN